MPQLDIPSTSTSSASSTSSSIKKTKTPGVEAGRGEGVEGTGEPGAVQGGVWEGMGVDLKSCKPGCGSWRTIIPAKEGAQNRYQLTVKNQFSGPVQRHGSVLAPETPLARELNHHHAYRFCSSPYRCRRSSLATSERSYLLVDNVKGPNDFLWVDGFMDSKVRNVDDYVAKMEARAKKTPETIQIVHKRKAKKGGRTILKGVKEIFEGIGGMVDVQRYRVKRASRRAGLAANRVRNRIKNAARRENYVSYTGSLG
ncbi:hypothetical protein CAC42_2189 [Sphaceloma murrayae]|uniref:Uncharacterized protein n=1 Tax=Sphaceloma murrayae TaxID=2082308 RepID=A0A2K1QJ84_9PEZI|nr:hypothetical protein CAC42_2189 [Sphaceloma murrayae]